MFTTPFAFPRVSDSSAHIFKESSTNGLIRIQVKVNLLK